jgi:hypothetical protein
MKELLITDILSKQDMQKLIEIFNTRKEVKNNVPKIEIPVSKVESVEALQQLELVSETTGSSEY